MRQSVIELMVAQRDDIRRKEIHDFDGANALVFGVDNGSLHHISGDGVDNVFLLAPHLIDIA